jgi:hypothetical protein
MPHRLPIGFNFNWNFYRCRRRCVVRLRGHHRAELDAFECGTERRGIRVQLAERLLVSSNDRLLGKPVGTGSASFIR